jgi:hypothetical protein
VTEVRGAATERVAAAGGCDGERGSGGCRLRWREGAAATEGGGGGSSLTWSGGGGSRVRFGDEARLIIFFLIFFLTMISRVDLQNA